MLAKKIKVPLQSLCTCVSCNRFMMSHEVENYVNMQIQLQMLDFQIEPICITCMTETLNTI